MKPGVKRGLKIAAAVLFVLVAIPVVALVATFAGSSPIEDGLEMETTVRVVKDGYVAVGMIDLGEGHVALIDAGNDPAGKAILAELSRRGLGPDAVSSVLFTHGHGDHLAGAHLFSKATFFALEAEVDMIEGRAGSKGPLTRWMGFKPTGISVRRRLQDGDEFIVGQRRVRVFAIPGHTAGSAAYLVEGVLFLGDSAGMKSDGTLRAAPYLFSDSQAENKASLKLLARRLALSADEVKFMVPAHSGGARGLGPLLEFAKAD